MDGSTGTDDRQDHDVSAATPRAILARLVSFPTVSRDTNLPLIDWAEAWLAARGIPATRVPDATGSKAQLYAHVGPRAPGDAPSGVLLSGHSDVVPVDGQAWTSDPFTLTERSGRLYGRGAADMKGFVALALWAMGRAAEAQAAGRLRRPLQIAISRDEEVGCIGAPEMLEHMAAHGFPRPEAAIIGEPTRMACVTAHKGSTQIPVTVRGFEVHSSLIHTGVSAIHEAARVIDWASAMNAEAAATAPDATAALFDPPWTSLHVGEIRGGTAHNITAAECRFGLGIRALPGDPVEGWIDRLRAFLAPLEARMQAIHRGAGFTLGAPIDLPAFAPEPGGAAERLVRRLTGDNGSHVVSYGTEAGQFQRAGYSAVVCGPGDIAQAHQPDEFIEVAQLEAGQRFLERLLDDLCAPSA